MRFLIVEHWKVDANGLVSPSHVEQTNHGEKKPAVRDDGYLAVLDAEGEVAGYAKGMWRRWWYESK